MRKLRTPPQVALAQVPAFLERLANNNMGIAPIPLTGGRFVVVSKPEYVQAILSHENADTFGKGGWAEKRIAQALGPSGMFLTDDTAWWAHLRRRMNPAFLRAGVEVAAQHTTTALETRIRAWQPGQPVDLFEEFKRVSIEVLMGHLFGTAADQTEIAELSRLADPVFEGMAWQVFMPKWLPGGMGYHRAVGRLEAKVYALIERRKQSFLENPKQRANDLLWHLVTSGDPKYSPLQIRDQIFTLLMAGFDSTATVQCAAARELASTSRHGNVLRDILRNELLKVTGGRPVEIAHLPGLTSLNDFANETLQNNPAFPAYFRRVKQKCTLGGHTLAPDTQLIIGLRAMHRIPDFDRDTNDHLEPNAFGHGSRKCIAESMATVMIKVVLGRMLQRFGTWELADPFDHRMVYAMTWRHFDNRMCLSA